MLNFRGTEKYLLIFKIPAIVGYYDVNYIFTQNPLWEYVDIYARDYHYHEDFIDVILVTPYTKNHVYR